MIQPNRRTNRVPAARPELAEWVRLLHRLTWGYSLLLIAFTLPSSAQTPDAPQPAIQPFVASLADFYKQDWHPDPNAPSSTPAPRRGLPQPLDSPPFPSADWSYGGSPTLGEPDANSYPLMTAVDGNRSRTKLYGWFDTSVNGSTSTHRNSPEANDLDSNRFELNQAVLYFERLPNTVQRDHIDIGFHLTALYGTDYRYTTDKGYFYSQLVPDGHQYGFDPALEYVDIYFPHVAQGMDLRVGRFISIPGIEAQLSPNNYVFSHSLLYSVDPFTDTGALATIQLTPQWLLQLGLTASHDVAPWTPDAKPSADVCISYATLSVNDNLYACANGINDGLYAFNNLQQYDATWYHKLSKTVHIASEAYVMYQRNVPAVDPVTVPAIAPEAGTDGAFCHAGQLRCLAPEWAIDTYLNKELSAHRYLTFREDFLDDKKGQRTGVQTRYFEETVAFNQWIGSTIQFRPEVRFDHAWDRPAYDNGTHKNQFTAAADFIFHF
jgi:Putative beta-barrel porin-2, OmpL-like. bbp2